LKLLGEDQFLKWEIGVLNNLNIAGRDILKKFNVSMVFPMECFGVKFQEDSMWEDDCVKLFWIMNTKSTINENIVNTEQSKFQLSLKEVIGQILKLMDLRRFHLLIYKLWILQRIKNVGLDNINFLNMNWS
jgi:hypothetical protein